MDNVEDVYPLTPAQAGILYHTLLDPDPELYFEQLRSDICGKFDPDLLRAAWQQVIDRHGAMRTMFLWEGLDDPLQVVRTEAAVSWSEVDLRDVERGGLADALDDLCLTERLLGIDLTRAPLMRFLLARVADDRWHFVWSFHHIVLDGWSTVPILNEAFELYGAPNTEPRASPAFREYLAWLSAQDQLAPEKYWRRTLAGFDAATPLRLGVASSEADQDQGSITHSIDTTTAAELRAFAMANRVTVSTLVQAAWSLVLTRYSGVDDVVFGVTMSGRPSDLDGVEDIIGMFLNTLPIRLCPPSAGSIGEWLNAIQVQQQDINTYQHSSLADVHRWSDIAPGEPLFDSILVFENYPTTPPPSSEEFTVQHRAVFGQSHYPLTMKVGGHEELDFVVLYDRSRFATAMVAQLVGHVENALIGLVRCGDTVPNQIEILASDERRMILEDWNDTSVDLGPDATLGELFANQVAATPDAAALILGEDTMSYFELDNLSNQLANRLVADGVGPEVPVGISIFRSFEMVIGVLAVVKAGGVYVPLDPAYPEDRIALIADDAGLGIILTHRRATSSVPDCSATIIDVDDVFDEHWSNDAPHTTATPDSSVLITFTSGSTGRPKGVQSHHRGIVNRIRWQWSQYPLGSNEVCCQKTTLNFVDHLWELWGSLLAGTPQVLVPDDVVVDTPRFLELLAKHRIQRIVLVPSYIRALLDAHPDLAERLPDLRYWTFSGEAVSRALGDRFRAEMPHAVLLNFYGMSEVTLDATVYDDRWNVECETVPVGRPIANQRVYLLDDQTRLAPVGVSANIHVSGIGLSRGYWSRDDLTEQVFIEHPFVAGERLYRTGDHGRWLPSGDIEYLGRSDGQVKVRGSRVELGEVEATIRGHAGVRDCVVVAEQRLGFTCLLAYVLSSGSGTDAAPAIASAESELSRGVSQYLRATLPGYMVPASVTILQEFPRTPNGKLDRMALPEPSDPAVSDSGSGDPTTDDEARMLRLWSETLETTVGLDDNFFDAGGHSLIALRLASRIAREFDRDLPLASLFSAPTPRTLTAYLLGEQSHDEWAYLVPISSGEDERPNIFCVHGGGGNVLNFQVLGRHFEGAWSLIGVQASGVDGTRPLHRSIEECCDAYIEEILAFQPHGPYILAGYSAGGVIAYEIASRFEAAGREVLAVILLDTFHPGLKPARMPTLRRSLSLAGSGPAYLVARIKEELRRKRAIGGWDRPDDIGSDLEPAPIEPAPLETRGGQFRSNTIAALARYSPPRYDGYVLLFGASRINWAYEKFGKLRGWDAVATNLEYHEVPGRHPDLILGTNGVELAGLMASRLSYCLRKTPL